MKESSLNGKQRSYLKSLANELKPLSQLGKEGLTDRYIKSLDELLEDHELVKITILENFGSDVRAAVDELLQRCDAEFVQQIGRKLVIYRQSRTNPMIEIPGADNRRVIANKQSKKDRGLRK